MARIQAVVVLALLLAATAEARGPYYEMGSLSGMVHDADLIVVGAVTAMTKSGQATVAVRETLKGTPVRRCKRASARPRMPLPYAASRLAVFLLERGPNAGTAPLTDRERVIALVRMQRDPGPFVRDPRFSSDLDLIEFLGWEFGQGRFEFSESDILTGRLSPHELSQCSWTQQPRSEYTLRRDSAAWHNGFVCVPPCDDFGVCLRDKIEPDLDDLKPEVQQVRIRVDIESPRSIGSLTRESAHRFLHDQLASPDSRVVTAALLALIQLRDSSASRQAIKLLEHPSRQVRAHAADLLAHSRETAAVAALAELLDQRKGPARSRADEASLDPHDVSEDEERGAFIHALIVLGDERCLPTFLRALDRGDSGSGGGVGRFCTADCMPVLIEEVGNPDSSYFEVVSAIYGLVGRSNLAPWQAEPWMSFHVTDGSQGARWRTWWEAHRSNFRLVR